MKKFYFLLLAFALVLPFSCTKNNGNNNENNGVKMPDPATKEVATVISFPNPPEVLYKNDKVNVKKFELTEASRYIMTYVPATKAAGDIAVVGSYTYKDGVYTLSGLGSLKVSGNNVILTLSSGNPLTINATITAIKTSSDFQSNASRTWKVNSVIVGLSGGSTNIEKKFSGCDLEEIANYAKNNGVPFTDADMASFKGMKMTEVIFTGANTFAIVFGNGKCFIGTCSISPSKSFSYKLDEGNDLLNVSATGSIDFPANSKCSLTLSTTADHNGTTYKGTLEFDFTEQK